MAWYGEQKYYLTCRQTAKDALNNIRGQR
jgi:hypothetical protein